MVFEMVLPVKRSLTHRAAERLPVRMYEGVPHKLEFGGKWLFALVALVR